MSKDTRFPVVQIRGTHDAIDEVQRKTRKPSKGYPYGRIPRAWLLKVSTLLELQVLCLLSSYSYNDEWTCFQTKTEMAKELKVSERSIQRTLAELLKIGLVHRKRTGSTTWIYELIP